MKHLISLEDTSRDEAVGLLDLADQLKSDWHASCLAPSLKGATVANLFFEDSTRTRLSFELAEKRLGAEVLNFTSQGSSISKGESLADTASTICAMGIDAIVVRHQSAGSAHLLATKDWTNVPILNAGDGAHQHPTQALLDAMSLREHLRSLGEKKADFEGNRVVIVGDLLHSRVVRSNVNLLKALGAEVILVGPRSLLPIGIEEWGAQVETNFDEVIDSQPDAVMMLRVQKERMSKVGGGYFPSVGDYVKRYGLTSERFGRLSSTCAIMHPGPMNRGLEICDEAADAPTSLILRQVENGVFVRMAGLKTLVNGAK
ncbi:aspartate carbamoyltransferase catalytic subunit [Actinomycetaceae bacterium TAE3-ERU4]|nr:aspartate carbamoyltransferase catalytic subunit [Actinomycetaceae bacterium TAE3-ERU4]